MSDRRRSAQAVGRAQRIAEQVAEALAAAGHVEAATDRTGYFVVISGETVIIALAIDEHEEGHFDSPAHHDMQKSAADEYRQVLEAAGWQVTVSADGEGLTVTCRAEVA